MTTVVPLLITAPCRHLLFKRQHPAMADLTPEGMTTVAPSHPGAERYFREAGLLQWTAEQTDDRNYPL